MCSSWLGVHGSQELYVPPLAGSLDQLTSTPNHRNTQEPRAPLHSPAGGNPDQLTSVPSCINAQKASLLLASVTPLLLPPLLWQYDVIGIQPHNCTSYHAYVEWQEAQLLGSSFRSHCDFTLNLTSASSHRDRKTYFLYTYIL